MAFVENLDLLVRLFFSLLLPLSLPLPLLPYYPPPAALTIKKQVKLYESNCNGQLSILDIVRDLAKIHPDLVATHLAALNRIAQKANTDDVAVVKEIEMACASAIPGNKRRKNETKRSRSKLLRDLDCFCRKELIYSLVEVQLEEVPQEVGGGDEEEPKDFDEKVEWLNTSAAKCHNLASLRDFLRQNKQAVSYLEVPLSLSLSPSLLSFLTTLICRT